MRWFVSPGVLGLCSERRPFETLLNSCRSYLWYFLVSISQSSACQHMTFCYPFHISSRDFYLLYSMSRSSGWLAFMPLLSEILSRNYGSDTRLSDWSFLRLFYSQANADIVPEIKSQSLPSISFPIQHSRSAYDHWALHKPNYWQYRRINRKQSRNRYISVLFGQAGFPSYIRGLVSIRGQSV